LIQKKQKIKAVKLELKKARFAKMFETQPRVAFSYNSYAYFRKEKDTLCPFTFHYADLCGGMITDNHFCYDAFS